MDRPVDSGGSVRVWARLAYDGKGFHGWARQPDVRTVQGELERALGVVLRTGDPISVVCAGRTDAGVHAVDQRIHTDVDEALWASAVAKGPAVLRSRLNGVLPDDVRVLWVEAAPAGFDARFSAIWREYAYAVVDSGRGAPLLRDRALMWSRSLDVSAMNEAAGLLLGLHDFAAFCRRRPEATTVRTLLSCDWRREHWGPWGENGILLRIRADAFCHSMVRSLVGAMLAVGDGSRDLEWLSRHVDAGRRGGDIKVAPPHPLVLARVAYADDLAGQAQRSRVRREI